MAWEGRVGFDDGLRGALRFGRASAFAGTTERRPGRAGFAGKRGLITTLHARPSPALSLHLSRSSVLPTSTHHSKKRTYTTYNMAKQIPTDQREAAFGSLIGELRLPTHASPPPGC